MEKSRWTYEIGDEDVQNLAKWNLGRKLTDEELEDLTNVLDGTGAVLEMLVDVMCQAFEPARASTRSS